jgi:hypothetical protein
MFSRSQWPRGLRRESAAAGMLGLRVRIALVAWMSLSVVCCQVDVSARGRSLAERIRTECGVSCDHEATIIWMPWPTRGGCTVGGGNTDVCTLPLLVLISYFFTLSQHIL